MTRPARCMCDFPSRCGGYGAKSCRGCGGDLCICICGGEEPCWGCDECNDGSRDGLDDDDHDHEEDRCG